MIGRGFFHTTGDEGDTTIDGKQVVWVVGDSLSTRRNPTGSAYGPTPTADTVYQWDTTNSNLYTIGSTDILQSGSVANGGSIWPQAGIEYYSKTGFKPVFVTGGVGGTNYAPRTGETDNWSTSSTLYDTKKQDLINCLNHLQLKKPKYIVVILGINDARGSTSLNQIQIQINNFYAKIQADFPNTTILIAQIGRDETGTTTNRIVNVRKYLKDIVTNNSNCYFFTQLAPLFPAGQYDSDNIHLLQTGNNTVGLMFGRWLANSSYSKWPRALISSHFDDLSNTRKDLISTFFTSVGTGINTLDFLYNHKTTIENNTYIDWTFLNVGLKVSSTFVANSHIATNGTSAYWRPQFIQTINALSSLSTDGFIGVKVKTNTSPNDGVARVALGGGHTTNGFTLVGQTGASSLYYRYSDNDNTLYTGNTTVPNDSFLVSARNGGTKYLWINGVNVHNAAIAAVGSNNFAVYTGALNNNATASNFFTGQYEYQLGGQYSTANIANLYAYMEAVVDGW